MLCLHLWSPLMYFTKILRASYIVLKMFLKRFDWETSWVLMFIPFCQRSNIINDMKLVNNKWFKWRKDRLYKLETSGSKTSKQIWQNQGGIQRQHHWRNRTVHNLIAVYLEIRQSSLIPPMMDLLHHYVWNRYENITQISIWHHT